MSDSTQSPRMVKCPQCQNPSVYSPENSFRPFCSERCRLLDLGQWAEESFRIPVSSETPDLEEYDEDDVVEDDDVDSDL